MNDREEKPIEHDALVKRVIEPANGEPSHSTFQVAEFSLKEVKEARLSHADGWFRVVAQVAAVGPDARQIEPALRDRKLLDGHRPDGLPTQFVPTRAKPTHTRRFPNAKDRDPGGTIFGNDDRYLFNDTSFPWRITGKVRTAGGWGSGTMIGPRHVLTASHVVNWNADGSGNPGWATFTPAYFDGHGPWGELNVTQVVFWEQAPGSLTDQETAFDYVVLVLEERIGDSIGYAGTRSYDEGWNGGAYWHYVGYPGELSSGERPAFQGACVVSSVGRHALNGNDGYVLGHFNEFTPGQSGGAIWGWWGTEPWPRVVGVGSTIGSTAVRQPDGSTRGDNEYGGGPALSSIVSWARRNIP